MKYAVNKTTARTATLKKTVQGRPDNQCVTDPEQPGILATERQAETTGR